MIVVVFVVVILVGVVALPFFVPSPASSPISVPALLIYSPDNACGLLANPIYYSGFNSSAGANVSIALYLPNYNTTSCAIHNLVTNTTGFTLYSISLNGTALPGTIPASPATRTLTFWIHTPSTSYSGNVSLVFD